MKNIVCFILLLVLITILSACQPTPDNGVVQSKNNGVLEQKLGEDPVDVDIDFLGRVFEEYTAKTDGVTIKIDATPEYPEGITRIPVVQVVPKKISINFIEKAIATCFEGKEIYTPQTKPTKKDIEYQLKEQEYLMSDEYLDSHFDTEEAKDGARENYAGRYKQLAEEYATAEDESDSKKIEKIEFHTEEYYSDPETYEKKVAENKANGVAESTDENYFRCVARLNDDLVAGLFVANVEIDGLTRYSISYTKGNRYDPTNNMMPCSVYSQDESECTISEEAAKKMANELVEGLGLSDTLSLVSVSLNNSTTKQNYSRYDITYKHSVGSLSSRANDITAVAKGESFRPTYDEEKLVVTINDDGIVAWQYINPYSVTNTVNEGVELMPFSKILDIYKKQSAVTYDNVQCEYEEGGELPEQLLAERMEYTIDEIKLKLVRIARKDKQLTYLLVPVWEFSGMKQSLNADGSPVVKEIPDWALSTVGDEDNDKLFSVDARPVSMLINAIDGTIITADDCY